METTLVMSVKERVRLEVFSRVKRGELSVGRAAAMLQISVRQAKRIRKRYQQKGDAGLVHGLRGRPGNAARTGLREKVLNICRGEYADFGSPQAAEELAKRGLLIPRQTLWRWRREAGELASSRRVRRHRTRRERRSCVGELVQMDGSTHDWFEGRRDRCVLFVMVDDASGRLFCRFYESEDTSAAFDLFGQYVRKYGLPMALYVDKDSIYRINDPLAQEHGRQRGQLPLTQFGRAMKQLGVEMIFANSPQAKGRVERANGTLQDRLVKAMRLAGISTIQEANEFLRQRFLPEHNRRFACRPAQKGDVHRALPPGLLPREVLCEQAERVVGRDWCVSYEGQILQLDKRHEPLALAGRKITILRLATGQLLVKYKERRLKWRPALRRPAPPATAKKPPARPWRPPADHPWRASRVKPAPLREASLRSASLRSAGLTRMTG